MQDTLTNPIYAGRIVRHRRGGRPTTRYAFASGLALCGQCGGKMRPQTSPYNRRDDSRARHYVCEHVRDSNSACDAPRIDAAVVDSAFIAHLDSFFLDFEGWLATVTEARAADRRVVEGALADTRKRLAAVKRQESDLTDRWTDAMDSGDERKEGIAYGALEGRVREREALAGKITAQEAAIAELAEDNTPVDAMVDFWNGLSADVRGQLDSAEGMAEVNAKLAEVLASVTLTTLEGKDGERRVRIDATMSDRGDCHPRTRSPPWAEEDSPLPDDVEWAFEPERRLILVRGASFKAPIKAVEALSETGRNAQESWH